MAAGIVDCTGKQIMLGDKLRTPTGDVIEVCGAAVSEHVLFNAEACEVVDPSTPLTNTGHVKAWKAHHKTDTPFGGRKADPTAAKAAPAAEGDCVVWGT
jgi:hypothetical protein